MGAAGPPLADIEACQASDRRLIETVSGLDDADMRRASRLPGWSVGHVLTHIARNGDSVVRRLEGVRVGEIADQYPGGRAGRAEEIEAGAGRSAGDILADVTRTAAAVRDAIAAVPDDGWDRLSRTLSGELTPATQVLFARWREIEVHHADLGLAYSESDWPQNLARRWLQDLLPALPDRSTPQELLAWCLGRGGPPQLTAWQ
jgi:maleylpyruvate isomerase